MNKQELVEAIVARTGGSKVATTEMVDAVFEVVTSALSRDESVQLVGFGTFALGQRAARTGRHPSTGAEIHIAAAKTVKFTAGKAFKEALNVS